MTKLQDDYVIIDGAGDMHKGTLSLRSQMELKKLMHEMIGENEPQAENGLLPDRVDRRNQLRNELRQKVSEL